MKRIHAKSERAEKALSLVSDLQLRFANNLNKISANFGKNIPFEPTEWFRDEGKHGGGVRFVGNDDSIFNRASVNVSQVQYDDDETKSLASASAISTIIHPKNPLAPSVHIHISWTELKSGNGYWRIMADLNPAIEFTEDKNQFANALEQSAPSQYKEASDQGDRYFNIPVLERHRGVTHFYLENYFSGDYETDMALSKKVGEAAIDTYCDILTNALSNRDDISDSDYQKQLEYHTLYLFQVLTLDRGTTSGLLVHDQNDVGILGSLPSHINYDLLSSWVDKMQKPQDELLKSILSCIKNENKALVDDATKATLAQSVREHYLKHPEAIDMQATGNSVPTTVDNHK